MVFAGNTSSWGLGGVAFIAAAPSGHETLARRYLVTEEQFQDVFAQETGQMVGSEIDLAATRATGSRVAGPGRYDLGLYLGECAGHPMFTCTSPDFVGLEPNAPSDAYRAVVVAGLAEAHGMSKASAHRYIDDRVASETGAAGR